MHNERPNAPDRRQVVLNGLNMAGRGIEVAPYFNPFLDKSEYNVVYTDYVSTEQLREKASTNPGAVTKYVPEIDFVWKPGKSLRECIGNSDLFDYAFASHVVEHVPNTIGWLNDILDTMKVGATLCLIVPDRRDTFDFYRRETSASDLIGAYIERRAIPTPTQVFEFMSRCVEDTGIRPKIFGDGVAFENTKRPYTDEDALSTTIWTFNQDHYIDAHCTVWTDESFVKTFRHIASLGLMNVTVSDAYVPGPGEFIVHLTKLGDPKVRAPEPKNLSQSKEMDYISTIASLQKDLVLAQSLSAQNAPKVQIANVDHASTIVELQRDLAHARKAFTESATMNENLSRQLSSAGGSDHQATSTDLQKDLDHARRAFHESAAMNKDFSERREPGYVARIAELEKDLAHARGAFAKCAELLNAATQASFRSKFGKTLIGRAARKVLRRPSGLSVAKPV